MKEFSAETRRQNFDHLSNQTFDLLVVGGGIVGAGIARDASLRGLRVCLAEKGDFASGTSSKTTKLVHGGLRYLEQFDFGLVAESCSERHLLLTKLATHLVKPMSFILPIYKNRGSGRWKLKAGMMLYDLLSMFRNVHTHQFISTKQILQKLPQLSSENLVGGFVYYDAQTWDSRLVMANILDAHEHGATLLNYTLAKQPVQTKTGWRTELIDQQGRKTVSVEAAHVVRAVGPWEEGLRLAKGVHIVLPHATLPLASGLMWELPWDHRRVFMIPRGNVTLIGTTDTDYSGTADDIKIETEDVKYLLRAIRDAFPNISISESQIIHTYAGVRPLLASNAKNSSTISRRHEIQNKNGIWHVSGGKLTTFRKMAKEMVDQITDEPCKTDQIPLPISPLDTLYWNGNTKEILAQRPYAEKFEMVLTDEDFTHRRTPLAFWGIP